MKKYKQSNAAQAEKQHHPQVEAKNVDLQKKNDSKQEQAEDERSYENAGSHRKLQLRQRCHACRAPIISHDVNAELSLSQNLTSVD